MSGGRSVRLCCVACGAVNPIGRYDCRACAGVLVVDADPIADLRPHRAPGIWRYRQLLPDVALPVSLGEGETPLLELADHNIRHSGHLFAKLETLNPTLSFKDRGMALAATIARDRGCDSLVVASTGNAAVSASAYAAAAGLRCRVIVGNSAGTAGKLDACRTYGAEIARVDGDYSAAYAAAKEAEADGIMNVSTTYRNPLIAEGYRSVAVELVEELGTVPDVVIVPVGAGPFLRGISQGFADLRNLAQTVSMPRLIGVQAAGCAPLDRAWKAGADEMAWRSSLAAPVQSSSTVAGAIADALRGYEDQGLLTLAAVRESRGAIVAVDEAEIAAATAALRSCGIWTEPSSATALAALPKIELQDEGLVVLMLTGHGIKTQSA